jgi:hypothetical protein
MIPRAAMRCTVPLQQKQRPRWISIRQEDARPQSAQEDICDKNELSDRGIVSNDDLKIMVGD